MANFMTKNQRITENCRKHNFGSKKANDYIDFQIYRFQHFLTNNLNLASSSIFLKKYGRDDFSSPILVRMAQPVLFLFSFK